MVSFDTRPPTGPQCHMDRAHVKDSLAESTQLPLCHLSGGAGIAMCLPPALLPLNCFVAVVCRNTSCCCYVPTAHAAAGMFRGHEDCSALCNLPGPHVTASVSCCHHHTAAIAAFANVGAIPAAATAVTACLLCLHTSTGTTYIAPARLPAHRQLLLLLLPACCCCCCCLMLALCS